MLIKRYNPKSKNITFVIKHKKGNNEKIILKGIVLRGGVSMAVLAKGKPVMFNIRQEMAKEFIEKSNEKVITQRFIDECKKASGLFRKRM